MLAGAVLSGIVDVVPPGVDVEVPLTSIVVVVGSVVAGGHVGGEDVVGHVGAVAVGQVRGVVEVVVGSVVVVSNRVVVVHGQVAGGDVVGPVVGTTPGTVVDVLDVDEVVVVLEVVLVDELVVTRPAQRPTSTAGVFGGRRGSEVVDGDGTTAGTTEELVVVPVVDVVITTSEVGPTRSGIRPSFP